MNQKLSGFDVAVKTTVLFLLVLPSVLYCVPAKADGQPFPTLSRHSRDYESACTNGNLRELKKNLDEIKIKAPDQAWKAITVLLCGAATKSNQHYIASLLTPKVEWYAGGIDDDPTPKLVNRKKISVEDLFSHGIAFNARIADMPNLLEVNYYLNEACVASKKLEYIGNRWRLTGVSSACD